MTFAGTFSGAEAYGANGEVVFINNGTHRRYLATPDYTAPAADIMKAQGEKVFFENGKFYVTLGRSVFEIQ